MVNAIWKGYRHILWEFVPSCGFPSYVHNPGNSQSIWENFSNVSLNGERDASSLHQTVAIKKKKSRGLNAQPFLDTVENLNCTSWLIIQVSLSPFHPEYSHTHAQQSCIFSQMSILSIQASSRLYEVYTQFGLQKSG